MIRLRWHYIALAAVSTHLLLPTGGAAAQGGQSDKPPWQLGVRAATPVRYDDNPFRRDPEGKRRLEFLSRDDRRSGRFAGMESVDDLIPVPTLELDLEGPPIAGAKLALEAEAGYYTNLFNARRRNLQLEFEVALSARASRLRLITEWQPSYFPNNYLADAQDVDGDGEIGDGERRYQAGRAHQVEVALLYRHRLVSQTRTRAIEVLAEFGPGYTRTSYDPPFVGRKRAGPQALAELSIEGKKWELELEYGFEWLHDEPGREIMILDGARAFEVVDRSRREHELGIQFERQFGERFEAELSYGRRIRYYTSQAPFDDHRGRRNSRNVFELELDAQVRSGLHVILGGWRGVQWTMQPGQPREIDYRQTVVMFGLEYEFGCPSIRGRAGHLAWDDACRRRL